MPDLPAANEVLAAMITPAVLISASGTLALSTSNRLARVVDRVRVLAQEAERMPDGLAGSPEELERRTLIRDEITSLGLRLRFLWTTLTFLYVAIGLLVLTSLTVGLATVLVPWLNWVPVGSALAGGAALFAASVFLLRECRAAVKSSVKEMEFVRATLARKAASQ